MAEPTSEIGSFATTALATVAGRSGDYSCFLSHGGTYKVSSAISTSSKSSFKALDFLQLGAFQHCENHDVLTKPT
jgi:hypothetical protein